MTYVPHRVTVTTPAFRMHKFSCSCGVILYCGPNTSVGETAENRHIRENLGGYKPPPSSSTIDWDHLGTWFLLGWLLSD